MTILTSTGQSLTDILSGDVPDRFAPRSAELPEKHVTILVKGLAPGLICHNGLLADASNPMTARIKSLVDKVKAGSSAEVERQLTEARMLGGLYLNSDQQPVLPQFMLAKALALGASKYNVKKGKHWMSGINVRGDAKIIHAGPDDVQVLAADQEFQFTCIVVINKNKVIGTRPIFKQWAAELQISYETDLVDEDTVIQIVSAAGRYVGLGDWRPEKRGKHGRFVVMGVSEA